MTRPDELDFGDAEVTMVHDLRELTDNDPVSAVLFEIGDRRGRQTPEVLDWACEQFAQLMARSDLPSIMISLGGYDDDPREAWDIPEACAYVAAFFERIYQQHGMTWQARVTAESTAFMTACCYENLRTMMPAGRA